MRSLSQAARETRDKRKQYVKYQEGAELYSMGVSRFKQMAHECESVIVVDLDPQASLTLCMGYRESDKLDHSITEVISAVVNDDELPDGFGIIHVRDNLDLLPSNINLSATEVSLVNAMSRELVLRTYMEQVRSQYDYVLIDCIRRLVKRFGGQVHLIRRR